jgi:DNA polymerase
MVIGEAPGENEDKMGVPFVGHAGKLLDAFFATVSVHPELIEMSKNEDFDYERIREILLTDVFYTSVVCCRPPENRDPTTKEVETCRPRLMETIYTVDPTLIIATGRIPCEALLQKRKVSITQMHGEVFDITVEGRLIELHYPMMALLHPSYLMRINDFNQVGGMGDKTCQNMLLAMHLVDWFDHLHRDIDLPPRKKLRR